MLISAGTLVAGRRVHRPGWVEVRGSTVAAYGAGAPERVADVDLSDQLVVPGFVDMHVHGGGGGSFPDRDPAGWRQAIDTHRATGTTTLLASLVTAAPDVLAASVPVLAELVEEGELAGIHLEGPWLSSRRCGAHDKSALRDPDPAEVRGLLAAGRGTVRMVTLAPERTGALSTIGLLAEAGVVAAVGHTDADYPLTGAAIDAGATVATHLFNAIRPIHHREPGPAVALIEDPRVTLEVILDGVHVHPALYRMICAAAGAERVALVTDAMAAAGMPDGSYRLGSLAVSVARGAARLTGTDTIAGGTATMAALFRRAVTESRLGPDAALLAAAAQTSAVPARVFGWPGHELDVGGRADLVVLNATSLAPERVLRAGRWVLPE